MTQRVLLMLVGGVAALGGLAAFLVLQGLDAADKWSSVLSLFFTVAGFALTLAGLLGRPSAQSADQAVTGGSLHQIRNVTGDVVIRPGGSTSAPQAPAAPSATAAGQGGGTQSARGARTAGDLHQLDGVGGSVRVEPPTTPTP
ncbi:hypothetical protein [Streptomyces venezuelae]|uniref:hypothetical protein n=1 Tax=Streptomyces venezuelae TaxID=54571 RepID=UPI001CCD1718|nr:hypothetical protein [Streptomyces venezuelae]